MRLVVLAVVSGALVTPLAAQWTVGDKVLVAAGGVALLADWSTSEWARRQPTFWESNPVLGPHPTPTRLTWYNVTAMSMYLGLEATLPSRYRRIVAAAVTAVETYTFTRNLRVGARFAVP